MKQEEQIVKQPIRPGSHVCRVVPERQNPYSLISEKSDQINNKYGTHCLGVIQLHCKALCSKVTLRVSAMAIRTKWHNACLVPIVCHILCRQHVEIKRSKKKGMIFCLFPILFFSQFYADIMST